jgi:SAM-dependent methyltransferase
MPNDHSSRPPTVAERRFAEAADELRRLSLAERFARMYETNLWAGTESRSGAGSGMAATVRVRAELPGLLRQLGVRRLLDVPCGDFHWMSHVDLAGIDYVGGDIVEAIIAENQARYGREGRRFVHVDLTAGPLPAADAVLCRDCLVHLSFTNIARALRAIQESGARYLIATTFLEQLANTDIADGDWRPLNLERAPFHLPAPVAVLVEGCEEEGGAYADKALAAWRVESLPDLQGEPRVSEATPGPPRRGES